MPSTFHSVSARALHACPFSQPHRKPRTSNRRHLDHIILGIRLSFLLRWTAGSLLCFHETLLLVWQTAVFERIFHQLPQKASEIQKKIQFQSVLLTRKLLSSLCQYQSKASSSTTSRPQPPPDGEVSRFSLGYLAKCLNNGLPTRVVTDFRASL